MMNAELEALLPYFVRWENIARYDEGTVFIGERNKFPFERSFLRCDSVDEVAQAIQSMVTQGAGPHLAASYAFALAAREAQALEPQAAQQHLQAAQDRLVATRPTNTATRRILRMLMRVACRALDESQSAETAVLEATERHFQSAYDRIAAQARFGADLIEDGDGILTMCFAEAPFLLSLAIAAHQDNKQIEVFTPETRPYLQGARLTAPSVLEMEIPVTLISDNMPAFIMSQGRIQKYFTAADLVTLDGHVVNKIGTFQNAVSAHHHGIPYFAFSRGPDPHKPNRASIEIEERDPAELRAVHGVPTTIADVRAYYPAFDITPPYLVSGVITQEGILNPYDLARHYADRSEL